MNNQESTIQPAVPDRQSVKGGIGALPLDGAVRFRVSAPAAHDLRLVLLSGDARGEYRLTNEGGLFEVTVEGARAGDRYLYSLNGGPWFPDPASRFQPDSVHGPSEVIDPGAYVWTDQAWRGNPPADLVIYELHVGTFTSRGTFSAIRDRLPLLREVGITAIELMPVADFAGSRNWGYDGVALFAPSRAYGRPDDLRGLVDAAHGIGLSVILDVVYNHLGPEGAYVTQFNPQYLSERHDNPWGRAVNLDGPGSEAVRQFIIDSAVHWVREYHFDGLRLDATHALINESARTSREHFVAELAATVRREAGRSVLIHAEDHRNLSDIVDEEGWGLDGVWADDFHHVVRRMVAGDSYSYYSDFEGTTSELARVLRQGWLFTGQYSRHEAATRGTDASRIPMRRFVVCVQNHDQIGNRAMGERLNHQIDAASWRAASALLLMAPMTPLLFMGQEWGAGTPFQFFTDLEPGLGAQVTAGRRREFKDFPEFATPEANARIPDPQAEATFEASRLRWDERDRQPHKGVLALYRQLLALRREHPALGASGACEGEAWAIDADSVAVRRQDGENVFWVVVRLRGSGVVDLAPHVGAAEGRAAVRVLLTTEDYGFAADPQPPEYDPARARIRFARPGAVVLTVNR